MTKQSNVILIVAIVGACCAAGVMVVLILAAVAIPAMQATIRHGNETSASNSLRLINVEEQTYNAMYPNRGFTCSLAALGGSPQSGPATADAAQLIPDDLASGHKAGYTFAVGKCAKEKDVVISYEITAVPNDVGHTGSRGYCMDQAGEMRFDPKGGTDCTELMQ